MDILEVSGLITEFGSRGHFRKLVNTVVAVNNVSFTLRHGEVLGVVGQSGSGKSTLAKTVLGLYRERAGLITLNGILVSGVDRHVARKLRADIQYVHQDPGAALDPWWTVGSTLHESLVIHSSLSKVERQRKIDEILSAVGLDYSFCKRYPHELSGGQQRRVGLARTLILNPKIVLLDEPTAGLDLSIQATVLKLITEIKNRYKLTYMFVSHDLSVVRRICDRLIIMLNGQIVESGNTADVMLNPTHEYTRALLESAPQIRYRDGPAAKNENLELARPGGAHA